MEIDRAWAENYFVTKANLMHERVHSPDNYHTLRGKKIYTSVPVYIDDREYNLYGIVDCLELTESNMFRIVEYKPSKPKNADYRDEDIMQLFAQKICVDYVFNCDSQAELYYGDVKKRYEPDLRENYGKYAKKLKAVLREMRRYTERGEVPEIKKGQKCSGCSMRDLCMPKVRRYTGFRDMIRKLNCED